MPTTHFTYLKYTFFKCRKLVFLVLLGKIVLTFSLVPLDMGLIGLALNTA